MGNDRILKLFCISLALLAGASLLAPPSTKFKEIDKVSAPKYLKRSDKAWERATRLIGILQKPPPEFTITLFSPGTKAGVTPSADKLLFKQEFSGSLTVYETRWLNPGKYDIMISANGYDNNNALRNVDLTAGTDCQIDITFGTIEYTKQR